MRFEIRPLDAWAEPETKWRMPSPFSATWQSTLDLLTRETTSLDARLVVIQLDVTDGEIRRDGMLRADAKVGHPGAVVSFDSKFGPLRYAADTYRGTYKQPAWQANVRAIALSLEALRAVDRWGASKRGEQYRGWTALPASPGGFTTADEAAAWMRKYADDALGLGDFPSFGALYRAMALRMHPDNGGPRADWDRLDAAKVLLAKAGLL